MFFPSKRDNSFFSLDFTVSTLIVNRILKKYRCSILNQSVSNKYDVESDLSSHINLGFPVHYCTCLQQRPWGYEFIISDLYQSSEKPTHVSKSLTQTLIPQLSKSHGYFYTILRRKMFCFVSNTIQLVSTMMLQRFYVL